MNKKQGTTVSLAIVAIALIATITMISPTPALALGHWNLDEEFTPNLDVADDGEDSSGTSDNTDEEEGDSSDEEEGDSTTAAGTNEEEQEGSEDSSNTSNDEDSSSSGYEAFQDCLAEIEESPTEEQVQDCIESSYGGQDDSEDAPSESVEADDEGDTNVTQEYEPRTVS